MTEEDRGLQFQGRNVLLFLVLVACGIAGNYFKFTIFFNIDFVFGSIFALIILQMFGLRLGVIAAAIISSITWALWGHPYAIITMTAEAAAVGVLIRRWKINPVAADIVYWLCFGIFLAYLFSYHALHLPMSSTVIIMLKQSLNGIANALFARIVFLIIENRLHQKKFTFREAIFNSVAFFALCTALFIMAVESRADHERVEDEIRQTLVRRSNQAVTLIGEWIENRFTPVVYLAKQASSLPPNRMQPVIEQTLATQPDFLRMGLVDEGAVTVAYAPLIDELGQPNIGKNFADRPYIPTLRQTRKPMLSEVVMGRIGVPKPFVSVLAPVVRNNEYAGYAIGVLNFDRMSAFISVAAGGGDALFSVLDRNGNIIVTNRSGQKTMTPLSRGPGELVKLDDRIAQWVPPVPPNSSVVDRWSKSFYVIHAAIGNQEEWSLVLEQPIAPFQKALYDVYSLRFVVVFCLLLVFLAIAEMFSRRLASSIEQLNTASTDLPAKLLSGETMTWQDSVVLETSRLTVNFRDMEQALRQKFQELEAARSSLEAHVAERTRELEAEMDVRRLAEARLQRLALEQETILNTVNLGIDFIQNRVVQWSNRAHDRIFGYEPGEALGVRTEDWYVDKGDYERVGREGYAQLAAGDSYETEVRMRRKNGEVFWARLTGRAIDPSDVAKGTIWVVSDVSERRQSDAALRKLSRAVEQSPVVVVITDLEGTIEYVNPKFCEVTGYARNEAVGQNPRILKSGEMSSDAYRELWQTITSGREWRGEFHNRRKDGTLYWESAFISPIRDADGNITHFLAIKEDVTDRKNAEAQIRKSLQEKEILLKEIHHRVKNNMQVISSLLDLQAQKIQDDNMITMFQESQQRVKSMALVHEKLYQTKDLACIDFGDYIATLANELSLMWHMDTRNVTIKTAAISAPLDVDAAVPCALILNELVTNCCKYAFPGDRKGTIEVDFYRQDADFVLTVRDDGVGLPDGFDPMSSETLGLQLVSVLAKQLRGKVRVISEKGTEVSVSFPATRGD
jgi:PAS domain S-box-containing protein